MTFEFPRHPAKGATRYWRGDVVRIRASYAGPMPVIRLAPALNGLRQLYRFVERAAIFHQIEHRQAIDKRKVVTAAGVPRVLPQPREKAPYGWHSRRPKFVIAMVVRA